MKYNYILWVGGNIMFESTNKQSCKNWFDQWFYDYDDAYIENIKTNKVIKLTKGQLK